MDVKLFIAGNWRAGEADAHFGIVNPATGNEIGQVTQASATDIDHALESAQSGFELWRKTSAHDRYKLMRQAADILRERAEANAQLITAEQGKPLGEARMEAMAAADFVDWMAEEARRSYGRLIPARTPGVRQSVQPDPVGPVAAFTPWNFPINQAVRKIAPALAAGCSVILKGPETTPASVAALVSAFIDAGLPAGVLNLLFGDPAAISERLIASPIIRKISFTGSTAVGKHLAALAGRHMKRITMELGGHAPVIICADADLDRAAALLVTSKFRNAGQVCASPTRFIVEQDVIEAFTAKFVGAAEQLTLGAGDTPGVTMGPLAHARRLDAVEAMVEDAVSQGGRIVTGGARPGNQGFFFQPTILRDVPTSALIMNEEPFGPVAPITSFKGLDEAIAEANRLPYGLAAYAFTASASAMQRLGQEIEAGMISINHFGLTLPETPFGGIKDSGYGSEGGLEAIQSYTTPKFVTECLLG